MNRAFEADAAVRELEELHEWVKRQRRNLLRIAELGAKTRSVPDHGSDDHPTEKDKKGEVKITREE